MQLTIKWRDGDGHDFSNRGTYIEYTLVVEASIRAGYRSTFELPGEAPEIQRFLVVHVESAVAYPLAGGDGYELRLAHEDAGANRRLIAALNIAMHADEEKANRLILNEWEREKLAA